MEYASNENMERLANSEERERLERLLGSFGLYDASQDIYPIQERQDEHWAVVDINPNIIQSNN